MRQITFFSPEDAILMESCVGMTLNCWKRWIQQDEIPRGWDADSALDMVEELAVLKEKIANISNTFDAAQITEQLLAEVEEAAKEWDSDHDATDSPLPQNVLDFPTSEA